MKDYTYLYRDELGISDVWATEWDLFISAFNRTQRVQTVFNKVDAPAKHWLIHREYGYAGIDHPGGDVFAADDEEESEYISRYLEEKLGGRDLPALRICIDITGFMRPHMMFLVRILVARGVRAFDVIYSEPSYYAKKEQTRFSLGSVGNVRQVAGFEGLINNDTSRDLVIIGAGYETHLIAEVAEDKDKAKKLVLLGLPSLSADMYQQNALRTRVAADALGDSGAGRHFAPANDPFVTATVLSEIVWRQERVAPVTNLYLSPLATKAQALGFVLYFLGECEGKHASIIFPFSARYAGDTSEGLSRIWKYRLEFPLA